MSQMNQFVVFPVDIDAEKVLDIAVNSDAEFRVLDVLDFLVRLVQIQGLRGIRLSVCRTYIKLPS